MFDINTGNDSQSAVNLRFYNGAGEHLLESPLEGQQAITRIDDDTLELAVTTHDSHEFRWWILGFGANVEVLEPKPLWQAIKEQLTHAAARYNL